MAAALVYCQLTANAYITTINIFSKSTFHTVNKVYNQIMNILSLTESV